MYSGEYEQPGVHCYYIFRFQEIQQKLYQEILLDLKFTNVT